MGKLSFIFTLTVSIATVNFVYGQQPYKLVDNSNIWYEHGVFGGWGTYALQLVDLTYFFNGDTIINGLTYKKLIHDKRDTIYYNPPYSQDSYGYTAAFRQDSLKVYFIKKDSLNEKLYCDFNISLGDPLKYYYPSGIITSIDSIPYGTSYRKKYGLSQGYSFYEGIGHGLGLFHNSSLGVEGGVYLVCFQQNGINQNVYQLNGTPPSCQLISTSIKEIDNSFRITVSQNPFSEFTTISFDYTNNQKYFLSLFDMQGRIIQTITDIRTGIIVIERKNLTAGLYFFQLRTDKQVIVTSKLAIE